MLLGWVCMCFFSASWQLTGDIRLIYAFRKETQQNYPNNFSWNTGIAKLYCFGCHIELISASCANRRLPKLLNICTWGNVTHVISTSLFFRILLWVYQLIIFTHLNQMLITSKYNCHIRRMFDWCESAHKFQVPELFNFLFQNPEKTKEETSGEFFPANAAADDDDNGVKSCKRNCTLTCGESQRACRSIVPAITLI